MNELEYAEFGKTAFGAVSGGRLARIRKYAGNSILDVGCGPGLYLARLADLGYEVAGVDGNSVFVQEARKYSERVYQVDLDVDGLSRFATAEFDTVLLLDVLEHVADDKALLEQAVRVARRNVLVSVPAQVPDGMNGTQLVFASYVDPTHRRYYSFQTLEQLMNAVDFECIKIETALRFSPILSEIFPWYFRHPLKWLNRFLLKFSHPNLLTSVWFAVGYKPSSRSTAELK